MSQRHLRFFQTISGRMVLFGMVPAALIMSLLVVFVLVTLFRQLLDDNASSLRILADRVAAEIEQGNTRAVMTSEMMSFAQESGLFGNREGSSDLARRVLAAYPEFTGAYYGYEPNADQLDQAFVDGLQDSPISAALGEGGRFAPYWFRTRDESNGILLAALPNMDDSTYYIDARESFLRDGSAVAIITEPYLYRGNLIV
jgi:methyl-accepting chemotaxis protein